MAEETRPSLMPCGPPHEHRWRKHFSLREAGFQMHQETCAVVTPGRRMGVGKSLGTEIKDSVWGTAHKARPWVCISAAKYGFMPFSCARLTAGHTPTLTHRAAKLAGPRM